MRDPRGGNPDLLPSLCGDSSAAHAVNTAGATAEVSCESIAGGPTPAPLHHSLTGDLPECPSFPHSQAVPESVSQGTQPKMAAYLCFIENERKNKLIQCKLVDEISTPRKTWCP